MLKFIIGLIIISSVLGLIIPKPSVEAILFFQKEFLFDDENGKLKGWNPGKVSNKEGPKSFVILDDSVKQFSSIIMVNVQDNKPNMCGVDFIFKDGRFDVTCIASPSEKAVLGYMVFNDND